VTVATIVETLPVTFITGILTEGSWLSEQRRD
jgi:hypothetical protein